ncbi:LacI family DNA-binding transcriptional regulator [Devosia sp. Leaf64]|uniref:LacI family DNA-binding transcriptional regulator n=1 Tax=Devosia sp. Leaf64 TaxID=1736229 RepID=UPI001FCD9007|nr:LacI family DNA-binding transcriptional regulator [Devosia sp. Leaf64]
MMPPRKPPTMQDIARKVGVSPMTVSRALRDGTSVNAQTRDAIRQAVEELGYVFDSTAANLRQQRTGFVAVTIPSINNANFADTVRGLSDGLKAHGLQPLLGYTDYDIEQEEILVEQLLRRRPEAIVVTGGQHTPRCRRLLQSAGIPVIETWDIPSDPIGHVVGFSNADAAAMLVDHLVATGRRRIAFIGGEAGRDTRGADRRAGFIAAMERHGLDATRLVAAGVPPVSMLEGAAAMRPLLQQSPEIDAVICVSDLVGFGALTECQRMGIAVPKQIAIAGFGNYEVAEICVPPLTTVNPFPDQIGRKTAAVVASLLGLEETDIILGSEITTELLIRASTMF